MFRLWLIGLLLLIAAAHSDAEDRRSAHRLRQKHIHEQATRRHRHHHHHHHHHQEEPTDGGLAVDDDMAHVVFDNVPSQHMRFIGATGDEFKITVGKHVIDSRETSTWPPKEVEETGHEDGTDIQTWCLAGVNPALFALIDWETYIETRVDPTSNKVVPTGAVFDSLVPNSGVLFLCNAAQAALILAKGQQASSSAPSNVAASTTPTTDSATDSTTVAATEDAPANPPTNADGTSADPNDAANSPATATPTPTATQAQPVAASQASTSALSTILPRPSTGEGSATNGVKDILFVREYYFDAKEKVSPTLEVSLPAADSFDPVEPLPDDEPPTAELDDEAQEIQKMAETPGVGPAYDPTKDPDSEQYDAPEAPESPPPTPIKLPLWLANLQPDLPPAETLEGEPSVPSVPDEPVEPERPPTGPGVLVLLDENQNENEEEAAQRHGHLGHHHGRHRKHRKHHHHHSELQPDPARFESIRARTASIFGEHSDSTVTLFAATGQWPIEWLANPALGETALLESLGADTTVTSVTARGDRAGFLVTTHVATAVADAQKVAAFPLVVSVDEYRPPTTNNKHARSILLRGKFDGAITQAQGRYPTQLQTRPITGSGITIGISDTGLDRTHCMFQDGAHATNSGKMRITRLVWTPKAPAAKAYTVTFTGGGGNVAIPGIAENAAAIRTIHEYPVADIEVGAALTGIAMDDGAGGNTAVPLPADKTHNRQTEIFSSGKDFPEPPFADLTGAFRHVEQDVPADGSFGKLSYDISFIADPAIRKVTRYFSLRGDGSDGNFGHGSHVSGSACGAANGVADGTLIGEYNGMAVDSKVAFFDMQNHAKGHHGLNGDQLEIFKGLRGSRARILSQSWSVGNTAPSKAITVLTSGKGVDGVYLETQQAEGGKPMWIRKDRNFRIAFSGAGKYTIGKYPTNNVICTNAQGNVRNPVAASTLAGDWTGCPLATTTFTLAANSGETFGVATAVDHELDKLLFEDKDAVVLVSAANEGTTGVANVAQQPESKNVLTVGSSDNAFPAWAELSDFGANECRQCKSFSAVNFRTACAACAAVAAGKAASAKCFPSWGEYSDQTCLTDFSSVNFLAAAAGQTSMRIKPDVMAPGNRIVSARSIAGGQPGAACNAGKDAIVWSHDNDFGSSFLAQSGVNAAPTVVSFGDTQNPVASMGFRSTVVAAGKSFRNIRFRPQTAEFFTTPDQTQEVHIAFECTTATGAVPLSVQLRARRQRQLWFGPWRDVDPPTVCPVGDWAAIDITHNNVNNVFLKYELRQEFTVQKLAAQDVVFFKNLRIWAVPTVGGAVVRPLFYQGTFGRMHKSLHGEAVVTAVQLRASPDRAAFGFVGQTSPGIPYTGQHRYIMTELMMLNPGEVVVEARMNSAYTGARGKHMLCCYTFDGVAIAPGNAPDNGGTACTAGGVGGAAGCYEVLPSYTRFVWTIAAPGAERRVVLRQGNIVGNNANAQAQGDNQIYFKEITIRSGTTGTQNMLYVTQGTSMSTPLTAGATALVDEYIQNGRAHSGAESRLHAFYPSGQLLKALVVHSAAITTPMLLDPTRRPYENFEIGAGIAHVGGLFHMPAGANPKPGPALFVLKRDRVAVAPQADTALAIYRIQTRTAGKSIGATMAYYDARGVNLNARIRLTVDENAGTIHHPTYPAPENGVAAPGTADFNNVQHTAFQNLANSVVVFGVLLRQTVTWVMGAPYEDHPQSFALVVSHDRSSAEVTPAMHVGHLMVQLPNAWVKADNAAAERVCTVFVGADNTMPTDFICNRLNNHITLYRMEPFGVFMSLILRFRRRTAAATNTEAPGDMHLFDATTGAMFTKTACVNNAHPGGLNPPFPVEWDQYTCTFEPLTLATSGAPNSFYHFTLWSDGEQVAGANFDPAFAMRFTVNAGQGGPENMPMRVEEPLEGIKNEVTNVVEPYIFPGNPRQQVAWGTSQAFNNPVPLGVTAMHMIHTTAGLDWKWDKLRVIDFKLNKVHYWHAAPDALSVAGVDAATNGVFYPSANMFKKADRTRIVSKPEGGVWELVHAPSGTLECYGDNAALVTGAAAWQCRGANDDALAFQTSTLTLAAGTTPAIVGAYTLAGAQRNGHNEWERTAGNIDYKIYWEGGSWKISSQQAPAGAVEVCTVVSAAESPDLIAPAIGAWGPPCGTTTFTASITVHHATVNALNAVWNVDAATWGTAHVKYGGGGHTMEWTTHAEPSTNYWAILSGVPARVCTVDAAVTLGSPLAFTAATRWRCFAANNGVQVQAQAVARTVGQAAALDLPIANAMTVPQTPMCSVCAYAFAHLTTTVGAPVPVAVRMADDQMRTAITTYRTSIGQHAGNAGQINTDADTARTAIGARWAAVVTGAVIDRVCGTAYGAGGNVLGVVDREICRDFLTNQAPLVLNKPSNTPIGAAIRDAFKVWVGNANYQNTVAHLWDRAAVFCQSFMVCNFGATGVDQSGNLLNGALANPLTGANRDMYDELMAQY